LQLGVSEATTLSQYGDVSINIEVVVVFVVVVAVKICLWWKHVCGKAVSCLLLIVDCCVVDRCRSRNFVRCARVSPWRLYTTLMLWVLLLTFHWCSMIICRC